MGHVSSRVVFVCTVWVLMTMGGVSCQKSQEPQAAAVDAESGEPQAAVVPESGEPQAAALPPLFVWGTPASVEARIRPILEAGQPLGEPALLSMT